MMHRLRVVPMEATEEMVDVGALNNARSSYPRTHSANIYAAMLAAAPREFTDEQIDAMCRLMWREYTDVQPWMREKMRAFMGAVNGVPMSSEKMELIELEPCPFCGKPGTIDEERSRANPERVVFVPSCSDPDCVGVMLQTFARRSEAASAWNARVSNSTGGDAAWAENAAEAVAGFVATYWVNGKPCPVCNGDASECQHTFANMLAAIIRQHAPQSQDGGEGK